MSDFDKSKPDLRPLENPQLEEINKTIEKIKDHMVDAGIADRAKVKQEEPPKSFGMHKLYSPDHMQNEMVEDNAKGKWRYDEDYQQLYTYVQNLFKKNRQLRRDFTTSDNSVKELIKEKVKLETDLDRVSLAFKHTRERETQLSNCLEKRETTIEKLEKKSMTRTEFLQTWMLNRSKTTVSNWDAVESLKNAVKCWDESTKED